MLCLNMFLVLAILKLFTLSNDSANNLDAVCKHDIFIDKHNSAVVNFYFL